MSDFLSSLPQLQCFPDYPDAPKIIPGRSEREWMNATSERFAYRCTPLTIANATGWELILPTSFSATWNGEPLLTDVTIRPGDDDPRLTRIVSSAFGHGVLTFHPGYLFRTSPGWALSVRGPPNAIKDGIAALEGLVETDWLPFTFTMNWRFTRPTTVHFHAGEAFCFITPVPHALMDEIQPEICDFADDPALKAAFDEWRRRRLEFNARLAERDSETVKQGWQRHYLQGADPAGFAEPVFHLAKRRMKPPK
jgi:hypothetical protein